ncbi:branched-chain amino acid ABC transporter permease [Microvirga lotononidis]|uniref:ABC-type branched-chain amino acid transport system, permease component n=1 Tax=Microvirga lotononidis TaxID=864069 RepID=I4YW38_9HYPH|nr:branched-chain amino acid ABC transporter permease [Microvirga lotononidis]EIM28180.1 ABC-type branched-chain amino acid transport system, permease component [Microvirga lotononidis]WQO27721.1 branched-chain amino acid ABC transporter permease [Microvirga lotononidis]
MNASPTSARALPFDETRRRGGPLSALLSSDRPRSKVLSALLLAILLLLAATPFLFSGSQPVGTAAKICVFIVLVASYDLLLGYSGIVSFAHTMFFGIGGYGIAIALERLGPTWGSAAIGLIAALALSALLAIAIGLLSLRVRAIFFSMITLAVASAAAVLASQLSDVTGGEDGLSFQLPQALRPAFRLLSEPVFGTAVNGRLLAYYLVFFVSLVIFLVLLRIVNSPFGRVLQAIRENEFRAEALGYRVVAYRTAASVISALAATIAGALMALWLRYNGPDTTLSFSIMIDILLMVVIGGMGTMYGAVIGAALFVLAQSYLQVLMGAGSAALAGLPLLPNLIHPDRWLLWLGALFIISVYAFPGGIVGRLRQAKQ